MPESRRENCPKILTVSISFHQGVVREYTVQRLAGQRAGRTTLTESGRNKHARFGCECNRNRRRDRLGGRAPIGPLAYQHLPRRKPLSEYNGSGFVRRNHAGPGLQLSGPGYPYGGPKYPSRSDTGSLRLRHPLHSPGVAAGHPKYSLGSGHVAHRIHAEFRWVLGSAGRGLGWSQRPTSGWIQPAGGIFP